MTDLHDCPRNCAVRRALSLLNPERAKWVQEAISTGDLTRREACDLFRMEVKIVVYPGSLSRHKTHRSPLEDILTQSKQEPQPLSTVDMRSAEQFITQEYQRLEAINPDTLSPEERLKAASDSKAVLKAYFDLHYDERGGGVPMGDFYYALHIGLLHLEDKFKPAHTQSNLRD